MRQRIGVPTLLVASIVVLAGCSSGGSVPADVASASPTTVTPTSSAASTVSTSAAPTASAKPTPASVGGAYRYVFPLRCSGVSYGHSHHDYPATDMFAPVGCPIVSPVDGVVDEVSTVDSWSSSTNLGATRGGLSFSIIGVDGVRYYGSHLSVLAASIRPGVHVRAGQSIGQVGRSGDARGGPSHMHFGISWPTAHGIWWVRRGELYPWPYLDAWRAGVMRSPATAVRALHRKVGDRGCTVDC